MEILLKLQVRKGENQKGDMDSTYKAYGISNPMSVGYTIYD